MRRFVVLPPLGPWKSGDDPPRAECRAPRLHIAPRQLTCGSEPLLTEARRAIEDAFGAVINTYATSEAGVMARSFPGSPGLHLTEDVAVYEPVDGEGRPTPVGAHAAKLLVTNVINHALPLIRYELTDEVTFLAEPNPGPWTGRRIADIHGRLDDSFTYDGGVEVHPHVFRSALGASNRCRSTRFGRRLVVPPSRCGRRPA